MARKKRFVAFRDEVKIIKLIDRVAADRGVDRSDFIREAIRKALANLSYFSKETKKALGVYSKEEK